MAAHAGPDAIESGLVLNLDAANLKSYPGSGTAWNDLSGAGNTGTLTNGPTFSSSNNGIVIFDGSNDFTLIADAPSLTSTTALTINCWVRVSAFGGSYSSIIGKGTSDTNEEYCLLIHSNFLYFDVGAAGGPYTQPSTTFVTNTWYNICCTHSRTTTSTLSAYVNSVQLTTSTVGASTSPIDNSFPVSIGSRFHNAVFAPLNGSIGQISIYNRALSATEIKQNFTALRGRYGL